jgi:hypothetical protein
MVKMAVCQQYCLILFVGILLCKIGYKIIVFGGVDYNREIITAN